MPFALLPQPGGWAVNISLYDVGNIGATQNLDNSICSQNEVIVALPILDLRFTLGCNFYLHNPTIRIVSDTTTLPNSHSPCGRLLSNAGT